ncbi:MAG: GNAT family N-acetyltransferase [Luteimonas sp.]
MNTGSPGITHDTAAHQFATTIDGKQAVLDYRQDGNLMVITHTGVPPAIGGRGIAAQLVKAAVEYARSQQWKVRPDCEYAEAYLRKHREYSDLLG